MAVLNTTNISQVKKRHILQKLKYPGKV